MNAAAHKLVAHWKKLRLPLAPGCPVEGLEKFEKQMGVPLPFDMRSYFTLVNGMKPGSPGDQDPQGFSFWPLEKVRMVPEELADRSPQGVGFPSAENFFVFADYLDWSWAYAIRLFQHSTRNQVVLIGKDEPELVAESFSEFVDLYVVDSPALYESPPLPL
jgi:cell wall assembly regulator SMI1